jgi:hypothetical protein
MRLVPASFHRVLDFVTVLAFAIAPSILGLAGFAAALSYALAMVHLAMTLLTRFSSSERRPLPLRLHGAVELIVGTTLVALPFLLAWRGGTLIFYSSAGTVILLAWAMSRYRMEARGLPA